MHNQKPHKGLLKRVKVTARGKVKYKRTCANKYMSKKPGDRRRQLRQKSLIAGPDVKRLEKLLHRPLSAP